MSDDPNLESREADQMGERPDHGRERDHLIDALTGTDMGSDTRAGSLQGGAATGSDVDPDSAAVNRSLSEQGRAGEESDGDDANPVNNVGARAKAETGVPRGADAATG